MLQPDAHRAQATAEAVARGMYAKDRAAQTMGIEVQRIAPGSATLTMRVRADMLNGFDICHGGYVTALADTAFAYACNSTNERTVASGFEMELLAATREGELLTASAVAQSQKGRLGVYDITVTNGQGERVALFRGRSYRLKGQATVPGLEIEA